MSGSDRAQTTREERDCITRQKLDERLKGRKRLPEHEREELGTPMLDEHDSTLTQERQVDLTCLLSHFPSALIAVARVHDYARGPLAKKEYTPSLLRHLFGLGQHRDHDAAIAWNALARLQKKIEAANANHPGKGQAADSHQGTNQS